MSRPRVHPDPHHLPVAVPGGGAIRGEKLELACMPFLVERLHGVLPLRALRVVQPAVAEGRCKLRPVPRDGWWELVWSEWTRTLVGPRGRVMLGDRNLPTQCANGTKVWLCRHPCGAVSVVLNKPDHGTHPILLFTDHPTLLRT